MKQRLLDQFLATLNQLPEVQARLDPPIHVDGPVRGHDTLVELRVNGKTATLLIDVKKVLYPRDVRQALWQFQEFSRKCLQSSEGRKPVSFLVARSISPGAKDLLRDERVGYYDSGGSLFLPAPDIYVFLDKPPPKNLSKSIKSLFLGRRAQVLHMLLMRHGEWLGVKETAAQARVSSATASQVLTRLERLDWVVSRGRGPTKERHLRNPGALLDEWAKQLAVLRPIALRHYFVPSLSAEGLIQKFTQACTANRAEYAITHEAAGQRYAPYLSAVSQVRCRLMLGAPADGVLAALNARIGDEGANLVVIDVKSSGELLFRDLVDGIWLASPVQVYLDLMLGEGRAQEMAKHLRQERIEF
ncbi:MAG: hypothetical protein OXJ37_09470 [Bryobacterales bacterium]|nr:hypothetical protein [Bryobacterales bacterium]